MMEPVLTGLDCPDVAIWRHAVNLRIRGLVEADNERWVRFMVDSLAEPSIYDQMIEEGWTR